MIIQLTFQPESVKLVVHAEAEMVTSRSFRGNPSRHGTVFSFKHLPRMPRLNASLKNRDHCNPDDFLPGRIQRGIET